AKKGYDKLFGARPLARVIQEHIKKPLAEELLFGKLADGGIVRVSIAEGKAVFDYPDPAPRKPPTKGSKDNKGKQPALVK
ncbi:MAG: hypothetical protein HQ513_16540, partial [Rhodospirillales bacterium]|nr:hypothetical protein [Rhodospirillales bacterium]